jgi:hypothetical protein
VNLSVFAILDMSQIKDLRHPKTRKVEKIHILSGFIKRRDNAMRSIDMLRRELAELDRVSEQTGAFTIA